MRQPEPQGRLRRGAEAVTCPAQAEEALRALPFVIKTHASQQKKDGLETKLLEIDGAIKAYSKEKVPSAPPAPPAPPCSLAELHRTRPQVLVPADA